MPARGSTFDFSIAGDEQEQHRIQLEKNLQHTDLSLHLSSTPDESDVEFPRHISDPHSFSGMASFDYHNSRDAFDGGENSHYQPWSLRADDDEEGIHPFEGTMSTAAHHASALTLSAGLGGRGARRDASMSGAEYDPDRPVKGIVAGIDTRRYVEPDSTKSRHYPSATVDFDPLVVDDTAELERILEPRPSARPAVSRSPQSSSSSSDAPIATPQSPRPKLSDALRHATFSPKRPRSAQSHRTPRALRTGDSRPESPLARHATPGRNRSTQSLSYATLPEPVVNVNPPTPEHVSEGSTFPRLAKGITKEIEAARRSKSGQSGHDVPAYVHSTVRQRNHHQEVPLKEIPNQLGGTPRPNTRLTPRSTSFKSKVHLPDITGLTSVVDSPARVGLKYLGYDATGEGEVDARILATLGIVQHKLAHLEAENSISRRRVRELESELEECKKEVIKERTKILDQSGERHSNQAKDRPGARNNARQDAEVNSSRYQEVVEEKKALEALISTLQNHLSRLTAEISDHHRLLEELRSLQERDSRLLKEKGREVEKLRQEVERLSGEVEVLRGIVEEGLKERRDIREHLSADRGHESKDEVEHSDEEQEETTSHHEEPVPDRRELARSTASSSSRSQISSRPCSPFAGTPRPQSRLSQASGRTAGGSQRVSGTAPFIDHDELTRISQEVEERRSERSLTVSQASSSRSHSSTNDLSSYSQSQSSAGSSRLRPLDAANAPIGDRATEKASDAGPSTVRFDITVDRAAQEPDKEAPPRRAEQPRKSSRTTDRDAGLPRVRGTNLERLFYSAPPHDVQTCTVCHGSRTQRRRASRQQDVEDALPQWLRAQDNRRHARNQHDDEGFDEDSDEFHREDVREDLADDALPPQTVLVKVLKELEDDFTHYKFIYIELADQYKAIDSTSNVAKRNVLAEHLQDVIQVLERKGDQIASLHGLLTFKDKPTSDT